MGESDQSRLVGKVALVTGAAKRLGRASALALAKAGADVAITFLHSAGEARRTVKELESARFSSLASRAKRAPKSTTEDREGDGQKHGGRFGSLRCDVTDRNSVRDAIHAVVERFGAIDILINNAGAYETVEFEKLTLERWDAMFATNVRGPFLVSQEAWPHLRKRNGRIIHLGSLGGLRPWASHAHYCASKAALHMLTKVMAKALAPEIAVNCVAPGMIDLREKAASEFMKRKGKQTPMQRNGTADDVAQAVMFFATAPHFITGQILFVDGGLGL
jgi:NAD(P)-dependent dehydrogenase (short-subunit alcohol dehydrogenase family)